MKRQFITNTQIYIHRYIHRCIHIYSLALASASSFDTSWNDGNMIFVYYADRAGPTEFIMIKSLLNFYDYH